MALIQVKVVEGLFSSAQKREIITRLTDTMVAIAGESMRQVTWVVLEEVGSGDWSIGGEPLCAEDILAVAGSAGAHRPASGADAMPAMAERR